MSEINNEVTLNIDSNPPEIISHEKPKRKQSKPCSESRLEVLKKGREKRAMLLQEKKKARELENFQKELECFKKEKEEFNELKKANYEIKEKEKKTT